MQEATALKGTLVLGEAQNIVMHGSVDCEMGTNGRLAMYDTLYPGLNFEMHFNQAVRPDKMMYNNFVLQTGYKVWRLEECSCLVFLDLVLAFSSGLFHVLCNIPLL